MAWTKKSGAIFTGSSGQAAVIAELLHRKCNAAILHVDVGTDVFAFRDDREDVIRIQVKTGRGELYKKGPGYSAKFGVPLAQLVRTDTPPLFYALAARLGNRWGAFIIISRAELKELWNKGCGSENLQSGDLELHIQFRPAGGAEMAASDGPRLNARCGAFDLTDYIDAWESLPPLKSLDEIDSQRTQA